MRRLSAVVAGVVWFGLLGVPQEKKEAAQEPPAELKIPPEEARRENPFKPTEGSIAEGKRLFSSQCAMCHGKEGDGKGDLADVMSLKLRDYRDPESLKGMTDGELFYILAKGKGKMPAQGDRMKADQRWHMLNFIRSLARKEEAPKAKPEKQP